MNRFTAKLVYGFTRLAFWRKRAASSGEELEPPVSAEPATALDSEAIEAESSVAADPVPQPGWFARLKQALIRRPSPAEETPADSGQAGVMERLPLEQGGAGALADEISVPKPSLLERLKSPFRRHPKPEPLEADEDTPRSSLRPTNTATASSTLDPGADEETLPLSLIERVRAGLSNKWVWAPGISVMLIATITMMGMLLQSGQQNKQLQIELVATQQKLKQVSAAPKPVSVKPAQPKQTVAPVVASAGDYAASSKPSIDGGDCQISNPENVAENLKNCIDSFNAMAE